MSGAITERRRDAKFFYWLCQHLTNQYPSLKLCHPKRSRGILLPGKQDLSAALGMTNCKQNFNHQQNKLFFAPLRLCGRSFDLRSTSDLKHQPR